MVRFELAGERAKSEDIVEFFLERDLSSNTIYLKARLRDKADNFAYSILSVSPEGITRYAGVSPALGIGLNAAHTVNDRGGSY